MQSFSLDGPKSSRLRLHSPSPPSGILRTAWSLSLQPNCPRALLKNQIWRRFSQTLFLTTLRRTSQSQDSTVVLKFFGWKGTSTAVLPRLRPTQHSLPIERNSVPLYRLTIGNVAWVTNRLVNSTFPCQSMLYQKCPAEAQRGRLAFWTISYPRRKYSSSSSDLPVVGSLVRHRSSTPAPNVTDSFIEMQQSSRAGRTTRGTLHIPHHRARAKECRLRRRMRFGVFSMGRYGIGAFPFSTCTSMTLMLATMRTTPPSGQRPKMARGRSRRKLALN